MASEIISQIKVEIQKPIISIFGMSKDTFLNQVKDKVKSNEIVRARMESFKNQPLLFTLKKDVVKEIIKPIRKYLKYKTIEDIDVNINCENQSVKNITVYLSDPEVLTMNYSEKKVTIYSNKVYESKLFKKEFFQMEQSDDEQLETLVRPLFVYVSGKLDDIFGKKKIHVPLQEKFKKRFF